jgi:hypothetical protein
MMINTKVLVGGFTVAVIGAAGLVWAYWNRGVTIVLRNTDSAALLDVTIHVTGRDYPIGDMPAGSTRNVLVDPTGESHIEISMQQAGGRGRLPVQCYFEAGYSGEIAIDISRDSVTVVDNQIAIGLW